jgi:hypothetical protein
MRSSKCFIAPLDAFLGKVECASLKRPGETLILDIHRDALEWEDWEDGPAGSPPSRRCMAIEPSRKSVFSFRP